MPLTEAGAALIGAGVSAASAAGSAISSSVKNKKSYNYTKKLYDMQNQFNAEQAQIAYDRQREFYDYTFNKDFDKEKYWAEYNSPAQQVARYKQAGLSPALLAGSVDSGNMSTSSSGDFSGGIQANASSPGQFQTSQSYSGSNMQDILGLLSYLSTSEVNNSLAEKNRVDAAKTAGVDSDKVKQDIVESQSRVENINANTKLTEEQQKKVAAETRETLYNIERVLPVEIKKKFSEIAKNVNDMLNSQQLTRAQVAKFSQDIRESVSRIRLNRAQQIKIGREISRMDSLLPRELDIQEQQFQQLRNERELMEKKNQLFFDIMGAAPYPKIVDRLMRFKLWNQVANLGF